MKESSLKKQLIVVIIAEGLNEISSRKTTALHTVKGIPIKVREIFLALKIESTLSKEKILELYFNKIYLGHRAYGVAAAAQIYYGKKN